MSTAPEPHKASLASGLGPAFRVAFRGIGIMLRSQPSCWIHAAATVLVAGAGFALGLSGIEWCCVILAIGIVWVAEALNTAIETLTDLVSPGFHPLAGRAKDLAAGAVLVAAITAALVGTVIFGPKFWALLPTG